MPLAKQHMANFLGMRVEIVIRTVKKMEKIRSLRLWRERSTIGDTSVIQQITFFYLSNLVLIKVKISEVIKTFFISECLIACSIIILLIINTNQVPKY